MNCPYSDENILSLYVEGKLKDDELKLFEEHLKLCDECMKRVMDLKNDLLRIEIIGVTEDVFMNYIVFSIVKGMLSIIGGSDNSNYKKMRFPFINIRGSEKVKSPVFQNNSIPGVNIKVFTDNSRGITLEINAERDIQYSLYNAGRLIESSHVYKNKRKFIKSLDRGNYRLEFQIPGEVQVHTTIFDFV